MKLKGAAQEIISAVNSALVRGSKTRVSGKDIAENTRHQSPYTEAQEGYRRPVANRS